MKLVSALADALKNALSIAGNPNAPTFGPKELGTVLNTFRGKLLVEAHGSIASTDAAKTIGPVAADGTDIVNADLAFIETVTRVEILDITSNNTYVYVPGVGAAKAVKIASNGAQTLVGAAAITVSGNLVTLGTAICDNGSTLIYTITGK